MSSKRAIPVEFRAVGLSDAFSVGDAFPGAMSVLQNIIPNPAGHGQWVPRPAAQALASANSSLWGAVNWFSFNWGAGWGSITGPGTVTCLLVVGNIAYGMIGSTSGATAGKDVPFVYDIVNNVFRNVTVNSVSLLPASQPLVGDWTPPSAAVFSGRVVFTHPGFAGGASPSVGWIDFSSFSDNTRVADTHSNTTIDNITPAVNLAGWQVGNIITGAGIPANTYIVSINAAGTSMVISAATSSSLAGTAITVTGGTPTAPLWGAGNTNINNLAKVPVAVFNFNGRAYYAVPGGNIQFSDVALPLQITNASQALTMNNGLDITCFGGLPINQTQTGPLQTLFAFQGDSNILKITGDAALNNLLLQSVPNGVGTLAPNTLASTPLGLMFLSPDGLRYVDFDGNMQAVVGMDGLGVNIPIINAIFPSRMNASYNEDVYRFSVQNGAKNNHPWEDYWFHVSKQIFSGPHTDPSCVCSPFQQQAGVVTGHGFLFSPISPIGALLLGSVVVNAQAGYIELGSVLNCIWQTSYSDDNQHMTENAVVESTLTIGFPVNGVMQAQVLNEIGTVLDSVQISVQNYAPNWGAFNWGATTWGGSPSAIYQRDLPWTKPIVFKQACLRVSAQAGAGLVIGPFRYNNLVLGYTLETFGGYV